MVRATEIKKLLREGVPPFKVELIDEEGNIINSRECNDFEEALSSLKDLLGGSFRGTELTIDEHNSETTIILKKSKSDRVVVHYRRKKQLDLMSFFK